MAGIFAKIRTLALSNIHNLLDTAIDLNSIEAIKQHVRDLEAAKESLADEAAVAKGGVNSKRKEISDKQLQIQTTNENIELILGDADPSNDSLAEGLEARLIGYEEELKTLEAELQDGEKLATDLAEATSKLEAKHREMLSNLKRLQSLERQAKAQEKAASALNQAAEIASATDGVSVDNVTSRLQERATVAGSRMERALGKMTDKLDVGVVEAQAKERIAARRAKMGASS